MPVGRRLRKLGTKVERRLQRLILEHRYGMPRGVLRRVRLEEVGLDADNRVEYAPSPWDSLRRILGRTEVSRDDVFLDLGCGMGSVVVEAAARYPFRRVIGVDIAPEFTEVAWNMIERSRDRLRCPDVNIVTADVIEYHVPDDVTLVYLADPFRGQILDLVIAKLIASVDRNPRLLRVIFYQPSHSGRLERTGRARLVRRGRRTILRWKPADDLVMYELRQAGGADAEAATGDSASDPASVSRTVIQVGQSTSPRASAHTSFSGTQGDLGRLRDAFKRDHCVLLPRFLSPPLLDRVTESISGDEFSVRSYGGVGTELYLDRGKAAALLMLLTNDSDLFKLVQAITGYARIARFVGRIYRMPPGAEYGEAWHGDLFGSPRAAMSINLSRVPSSGGVFELRNRHSGAVVHRARNAEPGDALLYRTAPFLQQRVTPVRGTAPRTFYVGRFQPREAVTPIIQHDPAEVVAAKPLSPRRGVRFVRAGSSRSRRCR